MDSKQCDALLAAIAGNWRTAGLEREDHALCAFAEKLTERPAAMQEQDVVVLRQAGFDDHAIHDAVQVIAYFNYINRVADGLSVELEPEMDPHPPVP